MQGRSRCPASSSFGPATLCRVSSSLFFRSESYQSWFTANATSSSSAQQISPATLHRLQVPVPPLMLQERVVRECRAEEQGRPAERPAQGLNQPWRCFPLASRKPSDRASVPSGDGKKSRMVRRKNCCSSIGLGPRRGKAVTALSTVMTLAGMTSLGHG